MVPVQILSALHQSDMHQNQSVTFTCHLSHASVPVTWYRDGVELADNTKYSIMVLGTLHKLCIHELDLCDEAVYTIKVDSSEKSSSAMLFLEGL